MLLPGMDSADMSRFSDVEHTRFLILFSVFSAPKCSWPMNSTNYLTQEIWFYLCCFRAKANSRDFNYAFTEIKESRHLCIHVFFSQYFSLFQVYMAQSIFNNVCCYKVHLYRKSFLAKWQQMHKQLLLIHKVGSKQYFFL